LLIVIIDLAATSNTLSRSKEPEYFKLFEAIPFVINIEKSSKKINSKNYSDLRINISDIEYGLYILAVKGQFSSIINIVIIE
jgi:hypothetical protein